MRVREVMEHLKELNPDQEIIIAWWEEDSFLDCCASREQWNREVAQIDNDFDWSFAHEDLEQFIRSHKQVS